MQVFLADIANQDVREISNQGKMYGIGDARLITSQEDVGLKFRVTLSDNGEGHCVDGCALSVWYMGASGKGNYTAIGDKSAFSVSGCDVEVEIHHQMLLCDGAGVLWLIENQEDGGRRTLMKLPYITVPGPDINCIEAQQYYQAFSEQIARLMDALDAFQTDKTLSVADVAADAAAVGKAISECAPGGFGIGEELVSATLLDDMNEINYMTGYYAFYTNTLNKPASNFGGGFVLVQRYSDSVIYQKVWNNSPACVCQRRYYDGSWSEWEWLNPPMEAGVEYRTAEKWNTKPVYTKLVDCGAAANAKEVNHGVSATNFLRFNGVLANIALPAYINANYNASVRITTNTVAITETGYDGKAVKVQIWYVKE